MLVAGLQLACIGATLQAHPQCKEGERYSQGQRAYFFSQESTGFGLQLKIHALGFGCPRQRMYWTTAAQVNACTGPCLPLAAHALGFACLWRRMHWALHASGSA